MTVAKVDPYQDQINHPTVHIDFCPVHHTQSSADCHTTPFKPAKQPRRSSNAQNNDNNTRDCSMDSNDELECTCPPDGTVSAEPHQSVSIQPTNIQSIQYNSNTNNNKQSLDRRFLIYMTILRDTDGRDKLTKSVQNLCKLLIWYLKHVNTQLHTLAQANQQQGNNVTGVSNNSFVIAARVITAVMIVTGNVQLKQHIQANSDDNDDTPTANISSTLLLSTALQSLYSTSAAARYAAQVNTKLQTQIKKIDTVTSSLSSARKVMRLFKWFYTLPALNKSYYMLQQDILKFIDGYSIQSGQTAALDASTISKAHSVAVDINHHDKPYNKQQQSSLQQYMSASIITRLPIFSTLEFISHSLSVATDLCDDTQWYSSHNIIAKHHGPTAAHYGPSLWGATIILDLILTYRQIRGLQHALNEAEQKLYYYTTHRNQLQSQSMNIVEDIDQCEKTITQLKLGLYNQYVAMLKLSGDAGCCVPIILGLTNQLPEWWIPVFSLISAGTALHKLWIATKP